jgi:hypothetical protein
MADPHTFDLQYEGSFYIGVILSGILFGKGIKQGEIHQFFMDDNINPFFT